MYIFYTKNSSCKSEVFDRTGKNCICIDDCWTFFFFFFTFFSPDDASKLLARTLAVASFDYIFINIVFSSSIWPSRRKSSRVACLLQHFVHTASYTNGCTRRLSRGKSCRRSSGKEALGVESRRSRSNSARSRAHYGYITSVAWYKNVFKKINQFSGS